MSEYPQVDPPPPPSISAEPEELGAATEKPRKVDVGLILSEAWRVFANNITSILLLALVVHVGVSLFGMLAIRSVRDDVNAWSDAMQEWLLGVDEAVDGGPAGDEPEDPEALAERLRMPDVPWAAFFVVGLVFVLSTLIAPILLQGAVTWIAVQRLRGRDPPVGESLSVGIVRTFPSLAVGFVTMLIILLSILPGALLLGFGATVLGVVLLAVGAVAAIILSMGYWVAIPVSVIERPGIFGAIARSWRLTKGHKVTIFLVMLVVGVVSGAAGGVAALVDPQAVPSDQPFRFQLDVSWVQVGVNAIFGGFFAVCAAVTYYLIRVAKEGVDPTELAATFD